MIPANDQQPRRLSPIKWAAGVLAFIAVIAGSIMFGWSLGPDRSAPAPSPAGPLFAIVFVVFGSMVFALGVGAYFIVLSTGCFTFNFDRPYFTKAHRARWWFANLIVGLLLQTGFALIVYPAVAPIVSRVVPDALAFPISFFLPFILAQLVLVWWQIWEPAHPALVRRRLTRIGLTPQQLAAGTVIGISDPAKSSLKKMTVIEEDMGMLWLTGDRMIYRGDSQSFDIPRDALLEIERKADAGSTAAYFGAVHVIIRYRDDGAGAERRVRLHTEGEWTMTAKARAQHALAERLESWRTAPPAAADHLAAPGDRTGGFPVFPAGD